MSAWVAAADVQAILAERDSLRAVLERIAGKVNGPQGDLGALVDILAIARQALTSSEKEGE